MHEVGIMQSALDIALEWAERQGAQQIHRLGLRVGRMAGVEPDALDFAFEVLKEGTAAECATLDVEYVALRIHCPTCDREFTTDGFCYACPDCGSIHTEIRQGRELDVMYVEVSSAESTGAELEGANHGGNIRALDG
jgi:hydrogenase nickel incorporation protein HypA/HybF